MQQIDHSMETLPTAVRREGLGLRRLLINDIIISNEVKTPHLRGHIDIILMSSVVAGQAVLFILEPLLDSNVSVHGLCCTLLHFDL